MKAPRPLVLVILDGWGCAPPGPANAITLARTPTYTEMLRTWPNTQIHTSGRFVGLPEGQMGNSEVGHLNMGAGRIVQMDITRLDAAIASGDFFRNPALLGAMRHARAHQLHLLGLCSDGGVHSHLHHLYALLRLAREQGVERVYVHAFTDGRDTPPHSGREYLAQVEQQMRTIQAGKIATVAGRYYAMDRDRRWDRIKLALTAMTEGAGPKATDPVAALASSYERGVTDEFVAPTVIVEGKAEKPVGPIRDDDAVIFFNFRADRARQMTRALARSGGPDADLEAAIPAATIPQRLHYVCMTQYDKRFTLPLVLAPEHLTHILAQVMGERKLRNLRIAETEKYAHVTYFFNGGVEEPFPGEERELIPSPKVATYDLKPEMSAAGVTAAIVKGVEGDSFEVIIANYANADMVGHSGKLEPTIKAVEAVDAGLSEVERAVRRRGGALIVTADHGNAETMVHPETGAPHTYHTTNPVPFILASERKGPLRRDGSLRDVAPTMLALLGVGEPGEMTGQSLLPQENKKNG